MFLLALFGCAGDGAPIDPSKPPTHDSATDSGEADLDGDGFAEGDCDDGDPAVYPGAAEHCDGVDEDCDGAVDEDATDAATWYVDADGDGFGDPDVSTRACDAPAGSVGDATDCDDGDATVHPGGVERCDTEADDDCDGAANEADAADALDWRPDMDGDGFGDASAPPTWSCVQPGDLVADPSDCDDADPEIRPSARDVCNDGIDQDCTGADKRCADTGVVDATDRADVTLLGDGMSPYQNLTSVVAGDVDGDGAADLAISNPADRGDDGINDAGLVAIVPDVTSLGAEVVTLDLALRVEATSGSTYFGSTVLLDADVDDDGSADLVVGAVAADLGLENQGAVYVFRGPITSDLTEADAFASLTGELAGDEFASEIRPGDFDGDGVADLALGTQYQSTNGTEAGALYVMFGPIAEGAQQSAAGADRYARGQADWRFGWPLSVADLDGDGLDDLAVGAINEDGVGAVNVYTGASILGAVGDLGAGDLCIEGSGPGFGVGLDAAHDLDGSGTPDIVVSVSSLSSGFSPGQSYLFFDPGTAGTLAWTDADVTLDVPCLSCLNGDGGGMGDVNGDGFDDLMFVTPGDEEGGSAWLFYGPISPDLGALTDADAQFVGRDGEVEYLGRRTGGNRTFDFGDVNADGFDDFVLPAIYDADDGWPDQIMLFYGAAGP